MAAKKKATKRKPRTWTRWAIVQDYGPHGVAFQCVGFHGVSKRKMESITRTAQQLIRVRITEVIK